MTRAGQICLNISTTRPQVQGATTYSGEKNAERLGNFHTMTTMYMIMIAIEKRGTEVKIKDRTAQKLSQKPYFRGATKIPRPTPITVEIRWQRMARIRVLGRRSAISTPTS